jgi:hypothetical protein
MRYWLVYPLIVLGAAAFLLAGAGCKKKEAPVETALTGEITPATAELPATPATAGETASAETGAEELPTAEMTPAEGGM